VEVLAGRGTLVVLHVAEVVTTSVLDPFHDTLDHFQNVEARETAKRVRAKYEHLCGIASPKASEPHLRLSARARTHAHPRADEHVEPQGK
jgi:hypothetical protein